jgi:hypothetical protein
LRVVCDPIRTSVAERNPGLKSETWATHQL